MRLSGGVPPHLRAHLLVHVSGGPQDQIQDVRLGPDAQGGERVQQHGQLLRERLPAARGGQRRVRLQPLGLGRLEQRLQGGFQAVQGAEQVPQTLPSIVEMTRELAHRSSAPPSSQRLQRALRCWYGSDDSGWFKKGVGGGMLVRVR